MEVYPHLVPFNKVKVRIPEKMLKKLFGRHEVLTPKEADKIERNLKEVKRAIKHLQHVESIEEIILLRR